MKDPGADVLRKATGTAGLEQTARAAAALLAERGIPHLVAGGLAVQEHGHHRVTLGVELIVPDVAEAIEFLIGDFGRPFVRVPGFKERVRDQRNGVCVELLTAGRIFKQGCNVPYPTPTHVSEEPTFVSLEQLISLKLDSWACNPVRRLKDKADVIELIQARRLSRDLNVSAPVRQNYVETWDALQAEK